jgi:nitrate reductase beta subunit
MNYFMNENICLLENQQTPPSQASMNDIISDMIRSGYDPTQHKVQAIADMKKANIPVAYIDQILSNADQAVVKQSKQANQAQRKTLYTDAQVSQGMVAPVA